MPMYYVGNKLLKYKHIKIIKSLTVIEWTQT